PTDPALSGPTTPDAIVLRHTLWCSPCYDASATAECRFGNPACMKSLIPAAVYTVAHERLASLGLIPAAARLGARELPIHDASH
ncbi:MAG: hypothetical protein KGO05_04535, partial [Chloroflexota bacterium]|nr:hypothetical protein [Chloroflexota bacterium]